MHDTIDLPLYNKIRTHMSELGHSDDDPDSQKIRARISMKDIRDRLGDSLGKHDISKMPRKRDFLIRSAGAGAITGAPIGAVLGAMAGAMRLIDKKKRKNWAKTMLLHTLAGAAIASAVGAASSGYLSNKIYNKFEKTSEHRLSARQRRIKMRRIREIKSAILSAMAYALPLSLAASGGLYAKGKADNLLDRLDSPVNLASTTRLVPVDDLADLESDIGDW